MKQTEEFQEIDQVIDYLKKEYKPAEYIKPDPPYEIGEDGHKIILLGGLKYDDKIFDVRRFLVQNKYILEEYYNRDNYPEFFDEDFRKYDYETLDIGRVSYLILRIFNIERISEGTIDSMVQDGYMLKLVERAKELKKSK